MLYNGKWKRGLMALEFYIEVFNLRVKTIEEVPESFSSNVYKLILVNDEHVILKIPYNQSKLERELQVLKELNGILPVPRVLNVYHGTQEHPGAMVLSYIDGHPITGDIDTALAYEIGQLLGKLHQVKRPYYSLAEASDAWWPSVKKRFYEWAEECKSVLDPKLHEKCILTFESMFDNLPNEDGPALIHFDFRPGNILIKNNHVCALIDFESSRGGSRDIDFTKLKVYMWDKYPQTKEATIKGYTSIRPLPEFDKTLDFYLFFNGFGGLAWCARRNKLDDPFYEENYEQIMPYIKKYTGDYNG